MWDSNTKLRVLKWTALAFWYVLWAELVLTCCQSIFHRGWVHWIPLAKAVLGLLLLTAFFVIVHLAILTVTRRETGQGSPAPTTSGKGAFPAEVTITVGIWLLALTGFLILGLFFVLNSISWPDWMLKYSEKAPDFTNAAATMFGAGIGSSLATILAYLEHASDKGDFDPAYVPWYIGRPLMGMLLGLIFYFLIGQGLLAVATNKSTPESLSEAGLTGIGALVGLFSKEAIEKLRELFNTLFSTQKNTQKKAEDSIVDRMPPPLRDQVRDWIANSGKPSTGNTKT